MRFSSWQQVLCFILAVASVTELVNFGRFIPYPIRHHGSPFLSDFLAAASFLFVGACVTGWAAWSIWMKKPSARVWAIVGSLMMVLTFFRHFVHNPFFPRIAGYHKVTMLVPGIVGLAIALLWPGPSRYRGIFEWLYQRDELQPPTMFSKEKKD